MDKMQQNQARQLVDTFRKTKERGEFRNKIGRVMWPMVNRALTYGIPTMAALSLLSGTATLPVLAFYAASWAIGAPVTKGFSVYVQNIALKNAAVFGRQMTRENVADSVKTAAMERYLQKAGALVFNKQYQKQNPEAIAQLAQGKHVPGFANMIAIFEHNINQTVNNTEQKGGRVGFKQRLATYQKTWRDYQRLKKPSLLLQTLANAEAKTPPQMPPSLSRHMLKRMMHRR